METTIAALLNLRTLPAIIVLAVTFAVMVGFGLVVLVRTSRKKFGWYFALTMLGIGGWVIGDAMMLLSRRPDLVHLGADLFYIAPMIIPIFIWFFALSFPEDRPIGWAPPIVAASVFSVFAAAFIFDFDFFVKEIRITDALNEPVAALPGFLMYASFFSMFFILTYIAFLSKMRRTKGASRIQVSYTFYGALTASLPALFTNLSLPILGNASIIWLGPLFTLFFAAAVTMAIVKHRLFDIQSYAVRGAAYLLTLFAATILYVIPSVILSSILLDGTLRPGAIAFLTFVTLMVAFLFQPLKRFFDRYTRKWFYQDAYDPQAFFNELNKVLVSTIDLNLLLQKVTHTIATNLNVQYCIIGIKDGTRYGHRVIGTVEKEFLPRDIDTARHTTPHMHQTVIVTDDIPPQQDQLRRLLLKNDIAVLARLTNNVRTTEEGLGYIVLGGKKAGNPFNSQDVRVVEAVANELVVAIQNALHFEEIENFNETLQQKVDEATKKLRATNEKLRQLDQTKDDFISMASHQLRTPLTSIKGYVSMVLEGDAGRINPLQRKLLNQSFVSSQRMVYLISDLLNVSRLKTGKFVIEAIPCNLASIIADETAQLEETARGRGLELTYNKPEHFPTYMLDETKMRQVIMNFIDNAIYYTPSGGKIVVELLNKPDSIEFTVSDNGMGVPKTEQHHLFSKFFRARNAKRARPDGTGLGLFMAKKVVVAQGGAIIFRSKEGKGSTFGFSFAKEHLEVFAAKAALKVAGATSKK